MAERTPDLRVSSGLSQGFNRVSTLGPSKINEFALKLKGREADLVKLAPIAAPKIRVQLRPATIGPPFALLVRSICRPFIFRATRSGRRLKPWAESSSPFGARPFGARHFGPGYVPPGRTIVARPEVPGDRAWSARVKLPKQAPTAHEGSFAASKNASLKSYKR
jgi:hypothetical protein